MKTIFAILFLTFNFSSYADFYIAACDKPLTDWLMGVNCESRQYYDPWSSKTKTGNFNWNKKIKL